MITITIKEALTLKDYRGHYLYIIKDLPTILYIGQSIDPIGRLQEHLGIGWRYSSSKIGNLINDNKPASDNWQYELLTLKDCEPLICENILPKYASLGYNLAKYYDPAQIDTSIDFAERALIQKYHPCLNATHNIEPTPLPEKYRKQPTLEETYMLDLPD